MASPWVDVISWAAFLIIGVLPFVMCTVLVCLGINWLWKHRRS